MAYPVIYGVAAMFAIATNSVINFPCAACSNAISSNFILSGVPSNCNEVSIPNELCNNINVLSSFSELQENWDGYGAHPFEASFISDLKKVLVCLKYQPEVFPTGRGSIQLEYEQDDGRYLEFECYNDRHVSVLHIDSDGTEFESIISFDQVSEVVDEFYGKV